MKPLFSILNKIKKIFSKKKLSSSAQDAPTTDTPLSQVTKASKEHQQEINSDFENLLKIMYEKELNKHSPSKGELNNEIAILQHLPQQKKTDITAILKSNNPKIFEKLIVAALNQNIDQNLLKKTYIRLSEYINFQKNQGETIPTSLENINNLIKNKISESYIRNS